MEPVLPDGFLSPRILATESTKGSKIYAAIKGAKDGGISIPHSEEILPSEERISGQHIIAGEKNAASKGLKDQFSKTKPNNIIIDFENIKKKIQSE